MKESIKTLKKLIINAKKNYYIWSIWFYFISFNNYLIKKIIKYMALIKKYQNLEIFKNNKILYLLKLIYLKTSSNSLLKRFNNFKFDSFGT